MKNNTRSITDFSQLIESLNESGIKNNVAVVWAEDNHTLDAVEMACKAGVITPILVCSQQTADKLKGNPAERKCVNSYHSSQNTFLSKALVLYRPCRASFPDARTTHGTNKIRI